MRNEKRAKRRKEKIMLVFSRQLDNIMNLFLSFLSLVSFCSHSFCLAPTTTDRRQYFPLNQYSIRGGGWWGGGGVSGAWRWKMFFLLNNFSIHSFRHTKECEDDNDDDDDGNRISRERMKKSMVKKGGRVV